MWLKKVIRVLLADDHTLVRHGIRALLETADDIEVVGGASDGQQAIELANRLKPDVIVMDITMPGIDGLEATERIKALAIQTKVVVLSIHNDAVHIDGALQKGASSYVPKSAAVSDLIEIIRQVVQN